MESAYIKELEVFMLKNFSLNEEELKAAKTYIISEGYKLFCGILINSVY